MGRLTTTLARCSHNEYRENCLMATKAGDCRGLTVTDFDGRPCPFYKNRKLMAEEEIKEYEQLFK